MLSRILSVRVLLPSVKSAGNAGSGSHQTRVCAVPARAATLFRRANFVSRLLCAFLSTYAVTGFAQSTPEQPVSFARDVRPILSDRCFQCHGPDRLTREADLRLDREDSVMQERDGRRIAVPGKPGQSELIRRLTTHDDDEVMPPRDSGRTLKPEEIDIIRKWVQQGAKWEKHWSYITPQRPDVPVVSNPEWPQNSIDNFVLARLQNEKLTPSPQADRRTLARRLALDLTGLPPERKAVQDFVADTRRDAYARFVEALLTSKHYGERMALPWLEASRYADTSGYQEDYGRYMYPWRTWVIKAFNDNMPFDRFVTEQMAGDLLPNATDQQILATAFHRNHRINQELGSIPDEFLVEYAVDRLETVGMVFLGSTIGCARCHDHKYDPITQKEFYELYAFLNNNDDAGVDQQSRMGFCKPMLEYPTPEGQSALEKLTTKLEQLKTFTAIGDSELETTAFKRWRTRMADERLLGISSWHIIGPFPHPEESKESGFNKEFLPRGKIDLAAQHGESKWLPKSDWIDGHDHFVGGDFTTFYLHRTILAAEDVQQEIMIAASDALQVHLNDQEIVRRLEGRGDRPEAESFVLPLAKGTNEILVKLSNAEFLQLFAFTAKQSESVPPEIFEILVKAGDRQSEDEVATLYQYFHGLRVRAVEKEVADLRTTFPKVMVMQEREKIRPAHLLVRGSYMNRGDEVERNTPEILSPFPADAPRNRLGLAQWLTARDHPLLARVTVNRFWQLYFGTGLVKTAEDFGAQGEWPSHPELLDWLAVEFIDSGWDVKHIQRLIVTSATYQQSSKSTLELNTRDPYNRLLARGARFRLLPHYIRDQALSVSGLLNPAIGGASVKPYQPAGLWSEVSNLLLMNEWFNTNRFTQDHGDNLYRRSLYTFWKRSVPPPNMTVFDAGAREMCSVRNEITNTPLQAMNLLNDVTYVEAARHVADRVLTHAMATDDRINYAMEVVTGRPPTDSERPILTRAFERHRQIYSDHPDAAATMLAHGESPNAEGHDCIEQAAWTQVALMLLNLDEVICRQ